MVEGLKPTEVIKMSVLKRGNSKFWYIQFQFNGKTYIRSTKSTDKKVADRMEIEWRAKLHAQKYLGEKETIIFSDLMDRYIKTKMESASFKSVLVHFRILNRLFPISRNLDEVTNQDVEKFMRTRIEEGVSNSTIRHSFNLIRGTIKYGRKLGYQVPDIEFPSLKVVKHRLRYLSLIEEENLLKELSPMREIKYAPAYGERSGSVKSHMQDVYDLVVLLLDTGGRYSEITHLEWGNVNLQERSIRLWRSKVGNESVLYMTDRVFGILKRRFTSRKTQFIFTNKKGGPRNHTTQPIRKAFKRCGFTDVTVHTFRHTFATRLIQNGLSVYEVKEMLGHTDIKTTMRYAHLEQRDISSKARDVINLLTKTTSNPKLYVV